MYVSPKHLQRSHRLNHTVIYHTDEDCPQLGECETRHDEWVYQITADHKECEYCKTEQPLIEQTGISNVPEGSHLESLLKEASK